MIGNDVDVRIVPLRTDEDVVRMRQTVREYLVAVGFSLIDQTKMITAASELGRNTLRYGGGGHAEIDVLTQSGKRGVLAAFVDQGPGIENLDLAFTDGYTSGGGMGLGLPGARRLADEFEIETAPGQGCRVTIIKWKAF